MSHLSLIIHPVIFAKRKVRARVEPLLFHLLRRLSMSLMMKIIMNTHTNTSPNNTMAVEPTKPIASTKNTAKNSNVTSSIANNIITNKLDSSKSSNYKPHSFPLKSVFWSRKTKRGSPCYRASSSFLTMNSIILIDLARYTRDLCMIVWFHVESYSS